jgi:REP element-mobilizing transposase RayT
MPERVWLFILSLDTLRKSKDRIRTLRISVCLHVYEFVIMSNHLHAIVSSDKLPLSDIIRDFKKIYSKTNHRTNIKFRGEQERKWMIKKFAFAGNRNNNNTNYPRLPSGRNSGNRITMLLN